jgi:hypothetical protein
MRKQYEHTSHSCNHTLHIMAYTHMHIYSCMTYLTQLYSYRSGFNLFVCFRSKKILKLCTWDHQICRQLNILEFPAMELRFPTFLHCMWNCCCKEHSIGLSLQLSWEWLVNRGHRKVLKGRKSLHGNSFKTKLSQKSPSNTSAFKKGWGGPQFLWRTEFHPVSPFSWCLHYCSLLVKQL